MTMYRQKCINCGTYRPVDMPVRLGLEVFGWQMPSCVFWAFPEKAPETKSPVRCRAPEKAPKDVEDTSSSFIAERERTQKWALMRH